ncbi:MAG: acetylglutamate kinase [Candidatus Diapherotrites archaeon]|uniref:Acetylglutamate kinase n=2 Tax=Candidatus Iainarchaeum sp. TaxID=3101447 RepID=A0A8T4L4L2_9ARCH|nr:acetylglutamate kinase [Candidatus Diapherotrites archaeon]
MKEGIVVVKLSGKVLGDSALLASVCGDLAALWQAGLQLVVVHGGGKQIDVEAQRQGLRKKTVNGLRCTDARMLEIVERVLTRLNQAIVGGLQAQGACAVGLNVGKKFVVHARKKAGLGFVGRVSSVDDAELQGLLSSGVIPVVSCLAKGSRMRLNVNADEVAVAVANAVEAKRLVFVSDVPGILADQGNAASLLSVVSAPVARGLMREGVVSGGMVPKVLACLNAVDSSIAAVQVIGAKQHAIRQCLQSAEAVGTRVTK